MADFNESVFDGVKIRRAAVDADDAVRLGELASALSTVPTITEMEAAIAAVTHPAATAAGTSTSIALSVNPTTQVIDAALILYPASIIQASGTGLTFDSLHPVVVSQVLTTGSTQLSNVVVTRRDSSNTVLATGVLNTDYTVNLALGTVSIRTGNLTTSATQKVRVAFDRAQVSDGSGLELHANGVRALFGISHHQIARGDHIHANDHLPASGDSSAQTATITVSPDQRVKVEVRLASGGGLQGGAGGLGVNFAEVATANHTHALVDGSNPGFMSPAMLSILTAVSGLQQLDVDDTFSIVLNLDGNFVLTAIARLGVGLVLDSNGINVDWDLVAQKNHTHPTVGGVWKIDVTNPGSGFGSVPGVAVSGDGTGATATAELTDDEVSAVIITNQGSGYTAATVVISGGGGTGATGTASVWTSPGFYHLAYLTRLKALETWKALVDIHLAAIDAAIADLEATKADLTYVDAADAVLQAAIDDLYATKADIGHTHVIGDIIGLQAALDAKADIDHIHPDATSTTSGFMSALDKQRLDCLANLLQEQQQALLVVPILRLESPSLGGYACPMTIASDSIIAGGEVGNLYTIQFRFRGKMEVKNYTGGTNSLFFNIGGTPGGGASNPWKLVVSDPPQTYYLNAAHSGAVDAHMVNVDYLAEVPVRGGATVTLGMDSVDGLQNVTPGLFSETLPAIAGIPPYPLTYNGQFVQVDPIRIVGECLYDLLFDETHIPTGGGGDDDDDNGDGGPPGDHTIEIIREYYRIELMDGGQFDEEVRDIRISGDTVWVAGKFRSYGNVDCFGLAKLNLRGKYDPFFQDGSGFSRPLDYVRPMPDGGVVAGAVLDSLCRGSDLARPLWRITSEGKKDTTFVCPVTLNEKPIGTAYGNDVQLGVAVLDNGYICSVSEQVLNVFKPDGSLFYQAVGNAKFNSITALHNKLLLTSHAWSAVGIAQTYNTIANPKGAKLLNMGDGWEFNFACIGDFLDGAGTEAVSTQMKAVNPDAIFLLGDNNYDFGDLATIDTNIGKYFRKFIHPYTGTQPLRDGEVDAVVNQCWPCPGNHDWGNILTARGKSNINPLANPGDLDYQNVTGIALDFGGSGYTYPPTVTIGAPDISGTQATAVANRRPTALTGGLRVHNARILRVEVNAGGTGYAVGTTLTMETYPGDTGSGATITPTIVGGVITAVVVNTAGSGYHRTPIIKVHNPGAGVGATFTIRRGTGSGYVTAPTVAVTSPSGSGATFNCLIMDGAVYSFSKLTAGSGYTDERDIVATFNNTGTGGSGAEAVGFLLGADIISFTITDPGAGYTSKPSVVVVGGGHEAYEVDTDPDTGIATYVGGREASLTPYLNYFDLPGNERYYKKTFGDVDVFFLDTDKNEPDGYTVGSVQYQWFVQEVGNSTARWKVVVGHHVPKSSRPSYAANNGWMDAWHFETLGVDMFIGGHSHTMEHIQQGTFDYFISGNGGKDLLPYGTPVAGSVPASRINDKFGFAQLKIKQDSLTVNFIDQDGALRYTYTKTKTAIPGVGGFGDIDQVWRLGQNAGTGAMSSCWESVLSPREDFFIIGNSLLNYNSTDTSWNAEQIGNLLLWSEGFDNAVWQKVGTAPVVVADFANNPSGTEMTADKIQDIDGVDLAYIYQDVTILANANRYQFAVFIKKDTDETRFPLFRVEFLLTSGVTNDCFMYVNTKTGDRAIGGTMAVANFTGEVEDAGDFWRVRIGASNNGHTKFRITIYPAYSNVFGSPSVSLNGSIIGWGASLRLDSWQDTYIKTEGTTFVPANTGNNSDRFRGLYKVGINGKEDPTFAVNITLNAGDSTQVKHVIPFGVDSQDRVYFGGPVTSINGTTVAPWMLYRVTKDGEFDKVFRLFNDRVLVARVTDCDTLIVGGKFTAYGSRKCGRIIWLNEDGSVIENYEDDRFPIYAPEPPDVILHPCYKKRVWFDTSTDPYGMFLWNEVQGRWQSQCEICAVLISDKLPTPILIPPTGNAPLSVEIQVPGYPNAVIHYTVDGSDPDINSPTYTNPISIIEETIVKAYAVQTGFEDSDIAIGYYWDPDYQQCAPVMFNPPSGSTFPCDVVLTCATPGATIYYEVGNPPSEPTTGSAVYGSPIHISSVNSIRAFAVKAGYADSIKTQANYLSAAKILDMQWRPLVGTDVKSGAAAVGLGGDVWNWISPNNIVYQNVLKWTDNSLSQVSMLIQAQYSWATDVVSGATDPLWHTGAFNTAATPTPTPWYCLFTNMPYGTYDFYVYTGRARLSRSVDNGNNYTEVGTFDALTALTDPPAWVENEHYVVFRNVVVKDYYFIKLEILVNATSGVHRSGVLHGIQIVKQAPAVTPTIPALEFNPISGSAPGNIHVFTSGVVVTEPTLKIHYTLDGSDPTPASPYIANNATVSVGSGVTIKAMATADGWNNSAVASAIYGAAGQFPAFECSALEGVENSSQGSNQFWIFLHGTASFNYGHTIRMLAGNAPAGASFTLTTVQDTGSPSQFSTIVDGPNRIVGIIGNAISGQVTATIRGRAPGYSDRYITVSVLFVID